MAPVAAIWSRAQAEAECHRILFGELTETERKAAGLAHDLDKAKEKTKLQLLTAPVDGVVQQLAIHTVGDVVTPAQALLAVVPSDSRLEIRALGPQPRHRLRSRGPRSRDQDRHVQFQTVRAHQGEVLSVSSDAIARDKPQDKSGENLEGTQRGTSEPRGQELVYAARISLDACR